MGPSSGVRTGTAPRNPEEVQPGPQRGDSATPLRTSQRIRSQTRRRWAAPCCREQERPQPTATRQGTSKGNRHRGGGDTYSVRAWAHRPGVSRAVRPAKEASKSENRPLYPCKCPRVTGNGKADTKAGRWSHEYLSRHAFEALTVGCVGAQAGRLSRHA